MRNIGILVCKELRTYFISPIAYVVAAIFLAISSYLFVSQAMYISALSMQMVRFQQEIPPLDIHQTVFLPPFLNMTIILLLVLPLLTMRLIAEEARGHTMELLATSPVRSIELVMGKFLAAWLVVLIMLAITLHWPLMLMSATTIAWKPLFSSYLGLALMSGLFVAIGLFASSLTENQIIAAVISFGILIGLWLTGSGSSDNSTYTSVIGYLSLSAHVEHFVRGLIDTRDLTYLISMTVFALFLTHLMVESRRWK